MNNLIGVLIFHGNRKNSKLYKSQWYKNTSEFLNSTRNIPRCHFRFRRHKTAVFYRIHPDWKKSGEMGFAAGGCDLPGWRVCSWGRDAEELVKGGSRGQSRADKEAEGGDCLDVPLPLYILSVIKHTNTPTSQHSQQSDVINTLRYPALLMSTQLIVSSSLTF